MTLISLPCARCDARARLLVCALVLGGSTTPALSQGNTWPPSDLQLDYLILRDGVTGYPSNHPFEGLMYPNIQVEYPACVVDDPIPPCQSDGPLQDASADNYAAIANEIALQSPFGYLGTYLSAYKLVSRNGIWTYPQAFLGYSDCPDTDLYVAHCPGHTGGVDTSASQHCATDCPFDQVFDVNVDSADARLWFATSYVVEAADRLSLPGNEQIDFVFGDNVPFKNHGNYTTPPFCAPLPNCECSYVSWPNTCAMLQLARSHLNNLGLNLMANVIMNPWDVGPVDEYRMQQALDGVMWELAFWKSNVRGNYGRLVKEIELMQRWLSLGKAICLEATEYSDGDEQGQLAEEGFFAGMAVLIREEGDAIYVARDFQDPRPAWYDLSRRAGTPTSGICVCSSHDSLIILQRSFQNGILTVNVTATLDPATAANAVTFTPTGGQSCCP